MTDLESAFRKAIDEDPTDWHSRLVYGDWLMEQGRDKEGFAQQWMGRHDHCPCHRLFFKQYDPATGENTKQRAIPSTYSWAWYPAGKFRWDSEVQEFHEPSRLPRLAFLALFRSTSYKEHQYHPSREKAEEALVEALWSLRQLLEGRS